MFSYFMNMLLSTVLHKVFFVYGCDARRIIFEQTMNIAQYFVVGIVSF